MSWFFFGFIPLFFYCLLLLKLRSYWATNTHVNIPSDYTPVTSFTIIIPARNEEKRLPECLQAIQQLRYPSELFNVIVVDDFSTDRTAAIASDYRVQVIRLSDHLAKPINSYKKKAIETGIIAATGNYIVTTDADCIVPPDWLSEMARTIEKENVVFLAAPVRMQEEKTLLGRFQALDFLSLQGVTGAGAGKGWMSMCNGANLCYQKKAFFEVNGFEGIDQIASGDDLLLMHKMAVAFPSRVRYCLSSRAIVTTFSEPSLKLFWQQRIRWASKATIYRDQRIIIVLALVYLINLFPFFLTIAALFQPALWMIVAAFILLKTVTEIYFLIPVARFFQQLHLLIWFPFMQIPHILYTLLAGLIGQKRNIHWKGRNVQ